MDSFGERLQSERQDRGLSIQAVAERLGIDHERLLALERNDFEALPDDAAMTECLRAYAECLDVDADLMIEDYVREREECMRQLERSIPEAVPARSARRSRLPLVLAAIVILLAGALLGVWWVLPGEEDPEAPQVSSEVQAGFVRTLGERPAQRVLLTDAGPPTLSIPEYGVGTGIDNRQLVGGNDRFGLGTQVWFWTLVKGGKAGDTIHHVWLHEGVETARVTLKIGGARWRTHSAKMLRSAGDWAVEARAASGHLLARSTFTCVP